MIVTPAIFLAAQAGRQARLMKDEMEAAIFFDCAQPLPSSRERDASHQAALRDLVEFL